MASFFKNKRAPEGVDPARIPPGQTLTAPDRWPLLHFVEPVLLCEVEFTEWTEERTLRHPVFKGLRES